MSSDRSGELFTVRRYSNETYKMIILYLNRIMSSDRTGELFPVPRYQYKNGDFEIDNPYVDKIALHPFMTFWGDNSKIAERLQAIQNMALNEDDILLAAYPKCVKDIVNKFDFTNLKKADKDVKEMGHEMKVLLESRTKENPSVKLPEIYRKGSVADWKNHFTVVQNEKFDALIQTEMKDIDLDVFYEITTS
ncbi:Hypothetical predicted protein [Mytilus galloprovincialis]|uniref:Sulfotransferase domain-containing protein n=1 Tax=Mytilus galloprovincialis TaxID=29158 RepID=A0A8B6EAR9_MYTGA|nr:Hypothetical predicted protein [Mytilus galloprovincialis]